MKTIKIILVLLMAVSALGQGLKTFTQTTVPKEKIPTEISDDVRKEIEGLYSTDIDQIINSAFNLGQMGERATPAIPFLIGLLRTTGLTAVRSENLKLFRDDVFVFVSGDQVLVYNPQWEIAVVALAKIGRPALDQLRETLKHDDPDDPWVVSGAINALSMIKDPDAVKILIEALKDENFRPRSEVASELGRTGDTQAIEVLIDILKDKDESVRSKASESLKKLTGKNFGVNQAKWLKWWNKKKEEQIK